MASRTQPLSRYSQVAIVLHWTIALLIIGNWTGGQVLANDLITGPAQLQVITLHESFGLTILLLSAARLAWRLTNPPPSLPAHMTPVEHLLAKSTHWLFYGLMFVLPLTGWAMVSANPKNYPIPFFWLFDVPHLPVAMTKANAHFYNNLHGLAGYVVLATLALHVAGALKHHYMDRDEVLARMATWVRMRG